MLEVEPPHESRTLLQRPTWQVGLKGVKVCAQQKHVQSFNHLQFGSGSESVNLKKSRQFTMTMCGC